MKNVVVGTMIAAGIMGSACAMEKREEKPALKKNVSVPLLLTKNTLTRPPLERTKTSAYLYPPRIRSLSNAATSNLVSPKTPTGVGKIVALQQTISHDDPLVQKLIVAYRAQAKRQETKETKKTIADINDFIANAIKTGRMREAARYFFLRAQAYGELMIDVDGLGDVEAMINCMHLYDEMTELATQLVHINTDHEAIAVSDKDPRFKKLLKDRIARIKRSSKNMTG